MKTVVMAPSTARKLEAGTADVDGRTLDMAMFRGMRVRIVDALEPTRLPGGKLQRAHKTHHCDACGEDIDPGEFYRRFIRPGRHRKQHEECPPVVTFIDMPANGVPSPVMF